MANDLGYAALANRAYKDPTTVGWAQQLQDNITALVAVLTDFKSGLKLSIASVSTVQIETGCIMINGKLRKNTSTATVAWSDTGGNTIAETSSTGYYIWAVASGSTSTFTLAINQTAASMTGNANARMIGWFWNNTANNIEGVWTINQDGGKKFESDTGAFVNNTSYFFNHNLGTDKYTCHAHIKASGSNWLDAGGDPGNMAQESCMAFGDLQTSTVIVRYVNAWFVIMPSGSAQGYSSSGSLRLFLETL